MTWIVIDGKEISLKVGVPVIDSRGRVWMICSKCRQLIRVNKPLLGSLHICGGEK